MLVTTGATLLSVETMTPVIVASVSLVTATLIASHARRQGVRRRPTTPVSGPEMAKVQSVGPLMSGRYRGRFVELTVESENRLTVHARVANRSALSAEFVARDAEEFGWLSARASRKLGTLALLPGGAGIAIRGHSLFLTCASLSTEPEAIRFALDLACDIADAVDTLKG